LKFLIVLASASLLIGCSKTVDISRLDGDWLCTEVLNGQKKKVYPMRFRDGQFYWEIPSEVPRVSVQVRADYSIAGNTLSMPTMYLNATGLPFDDNPGWSTSERSVVTGIEELTEDKLVLAPWKTTSSKRTLKGGDLRYECARFADRATSGVSAVATTNSQLPQQAHRPDRKEGPPIMVVLEAFTVNLQPEQGEQYLQVAITLQVKDASAQNSLVARMPAVRSRYIEILSSKRKSELDSVSGKQALAKQLVVAAGEMLGPGKVTDALFTSFITQ